MLAAAHQSVYDSLAWSAIQGCCRATKSECSVLPHIVCSFLLCLAEQHIFHHFQACLGQAWQTMTRPRSLWACPSSLQRTVQAAVCCFTVLRKAHSSALRLLKFRFPKLKLMADQVLSCSLMCDAFCTQLYSDQHLQQRLCVVSARKMWSHSMRCVSRQIW